MGYRKWRGGFRQPVRRTSWLRRIGDLLLFCALTAGTLYVIARYLPERTTQGGAWVIDGDSLNVDGEEIRLTGIDAPEAQQTCRDRQDREWPCGAEATRTLKRLAQKAHVVCHGGAHDKYGRVLARCSAGDLVLNAEMIRLGFAVSEAEQGYVYGSEQKEARRAGRGIWRGTFDRPREWRAAHQ